VAHLYPSGCSFLLFLEEKEEEVIDVDDTDGIEPAGEFDAWRLRELARIKRDKEAEIAREQEREEVERRRALPEEQRLKEDLEHANKSRDEKPKGKQLFLQKYWHKGAFHQVCLSSIICVYHPITFAFVVGRRDSHATQLY
jgi:microfibrillar-associated protein 1